MTSTAGPVKVAVITGNHPFDVPGFHQLLRGLGELDLYVQDVENFAAAPQAVRDGYDVVLFYDYHIPTPSDAERTGPQVRAALEHLGAVDQGMVVLHHALLSYPEWPVWQALTGLVRGEFKWYEGEQVAVTVVDGAHPIVAGLAPWTMTDETYTLPEPGVGSRALLATDNPRSMRTLAWVRTLSAARVFCLESGHDALTYTDPNFRQVLARGIQWAAGRL